MILFLSNNCLFIEYNEYLRKNICIYYINNMLIKGIILTFIEKELQ